MLENLKIVPNEQKILLQIARDAIKYGLEYKTKPKISLEKYPQHLIQPRACFVTLDQNKQLRGCIGTLLARSPLVQEVSDSAFAAAFSDPRFPKVTTEELASLQIHISILTVPIAMRFTSEQDLLLQLRPSVDGLILRVGNSSGTVLPSVWEQLPNPKDFLNHLKNKAGLPMDYWSNQVEMFRYETEMFGDI